MIRNIAKGHRNTRQRQVVMEIVRTSTTHPSATEVFLEARRILPHISLGTVYRLLRKLEQDGQIRDVSNARAVARFDGRVDHHSHLLCLRCGRVADCDVELPVEAAAPAGAQGFAVVGFRLDFYGYCRECRLLADASTNT